MKHHKYFRAQQYKQKLESKYNTSGKYGKVFFITNTPDPRSIRESRTFYERFPDVAFGEYDRARGRNYYMYFSRPEIAYSIHEYEHGRSGAKAVFKKQAKNKLRTACKRDPYTAFSKSTSRKTYDPWHFD